VICDDWLSKQLINILLIDLTFAVIGIGHANKIIGCMCDQFGCPLDLLVFLQLIGDI